MKGLIAFFVVICMLVLQLPTGVLAQEPSGSANRRYTVLALDVSGSMSGEPLEAEKQAALKFCESLFAADGENYAALVIYSSSASIAVSFTDDYELLKTKINSLSASGGTNITDALSKADGMLSGVEGIRNIVLLSDGLPESGSTSSTGPYASSDHSDYRYANAAYNKAKELKEKYNIYSLGFFHKLSGTDLSFGARLMNDLSNKGYYEVTDPDDLVFTFDQIAENMSESNLKEIYVNQHISYYQNSFDNEVQIIEPSSDSTRENINDMLGNIVLDAAEDSTHIGYVVARHFNSILSFDFDFFQSIENNYDLILADIITSDYYMDIITEAAVTQEMADVSNILTQVIEYVFEHLGEMADEAKVDKEVFRNEWYEIARKLDQMKLTDDPKTYGTLFDECATSVGKYIDASKQADLLSKFSGIKGEALTASVNAMISLSFKQAADVIKFMSCYNAYRTASDVYKRVLSVIGYYAENYIHNAGGGVDQSIYCASLSVSIEKFLEISSDEQLNANAIASHFAEQTAENFASSFAKEFIDILANHIPVIRELNKIRKATALVTSGALFLVDCMSYIDDISYSAAMTYNMYYLTNCAAEAAELLGSSIKSSSDQFTTAYEFDEAVRIWRTCALMLCDFGMEFEKYKLQEDQKYLFLPPRMKDASWRSTAISMTALQKALISDIHCHDQNLSYTPSSGTVSLDENTQIITIACPVSVTVKDHNGQLIASLSDDHLYVKEGYEPYFHVIESERGSGDFMKICYVEKGWQISYDGTGTGEMTVLKADIQDGRIVNPGVSEPIKITDESSGNIEDIIDQIDHGTTIANPFTDVKAGAYYYEPVLWALENNITTGITPTLFKPNEGCTRAQIVTFLWRLAGSPDVKASAGFTDVPDGKWFSKPVAWAVAKNITTGVGNGRFDPDGSCTRGQIVTFLWRYAGSMDIGTNSGFTDVAENKYYAKAVKWAVSNNITTGVGNGRFGPEGSCTRAHAVTFLYRMNQLQTQTQEGYTVIFDPNGGTVGLSRKNVVNGGVYGYLPLPQRSGYVFEGWYSDSVNGKEINGSSSVNITEDQTLYAHWKTAPQKYKVTFNPGLGSTTMAEMEAVNGSAYGIMPQAYRGGYTFIGWYTSYSGGTLITKESIVNLRSDQMLFARYTANTYNVVFNANGGSVSPSSKEVTAGNAYGTLPVPSLEGSEFAGWFTLPEGGKEIKETTIADLIDDQTLFAHWIRSFTVTFDPCGGSVAPASKTVISNNPYGALPVPQREGYEFEGWYTERQGGIRITETDIVELTADQTLYAHWSAKEKQLTSITVEAEKTSIEIGESVILKAFASYTDGSSEEVTDEALFHVEETDILLCEGNTVSGLAAGTATVYAEYHGVTGSVQIEVIAHTPEEIIHEVYIAEGATNVKEISVDQGDTLVLRITVDTTSSEEAYHKYTVWIAELNGGSWEQIKAYYVDGGTSVTFDLKCNIVKSTTLAVSLFLSDNFTTGASLCDYVLRVHVR